MIILGFIVFLLGFMDGSTSNPYDLSPLSITKIMVPNKLIESLRLPALPDSKTSMPIDSSAMIYIPCMIGGVSRKRKNKRGRQTFFIWYDFNGKRYNINSD